MPLLPLCRIVVFCKSAQANLVLLSLLIFLQTACVQQVNSQDSSVATSEKKRPNILMFVIDDQNDWIEPLGGHPQVKTPALRKLAARGMNFRNAHCQSPLCNSSRASVMLSLRPSTTGIYGLAPWFRDLDDYKRNVTLPQFFEQAGYETYTCGKVYHNSMGMDPRPGADREFIHWGPPGGPGKMPPKKLIPETPAGNNPWVDWGLFEHEDSEKGDWIVADWAQQKLKEMPQEKPFFMAVGLFMPHVPCHVNQKWWDLYPHDEIAMPQAPVGDRQDCSPFSWYLHWQLPEPRLAWLKKHDQHRNLVHSYLSSISFMDSQVQRVLDALAGTPHADHTIVVLWSDNGFHLGEKEMTGKTTLWERSTRVPLIFAGPGVIQGNCDQPVELLDIYPTLAELAGLSPPKEIEGVSLLPQIQQPLTSRKIPAITTHNPGNFGLRDVRYRLIHYADGSQELYDLVEDPGEITNRIKDQSLATQLEELGRFVPTKFAPLAAGSQQRILEKREDGWYWENSKIDPANPPCEDP